MGFDDIVSAALDALSDEAREVLSLRYQRGLSIAEIAWRVHQPQAVVRQRLFLARLSMKRLIACKPNALKSASAESTAENIKGSVGTTSWIERTSTRMIGGLTAKPVYRTDIEHT